MLGKLGNFHQRQQPTDWYTFPGWFTDIRKLNIENSDSPEWKFLLTLLSTEEINKVSKFHFADDKKRSLFSHLLQRAMTRKYINSNNDAAIIINRTKENKPYPEVEGWNLRTWNYNVSHHGNFVGIMSHPSVLVGLDIVDVMTRAGYAPTARQFIAAFEEQLHPYELENIMRQPCEDDRFTLFFIHWALKEAYIKAIGIGLGFELNTLRFEVHYVTAPSKGSSLVSGSASLEIAGVFRPDWGFDFFSLDSRHVAAVAKGPVLESLPSYKMQAWGLKEDMTPIATDGANTIASKPVWPKPEPSRRMFSSRQRQSPFSGTTNYESDDSHLESPSSSGFMSFSIPYICRLILHSLCCCLPWADTSVAEDDDRNGSNLHNSQTGEMQSNESGVQTNGTNIYKPRKVLPQPQQFESVQQAGDIGETPAEHNPLLISSSSHQISHQQWLNLPLAPPRFVTVEDLLCSEDLTKYNNIKYMNRVKHSII